MSSPLPRDADYEEEDDRARRDVFVQESAEEASGRGHFDNFDTRIIDTVADKLEPMIRAFLADDRWAVNVVGLIVPLGRSDLLPRFAESESYDDLMDEICEDLLIEIQEKLNAYHDLQSWLGLDADSDDEY